MKSLLSIFFMTLILSFGAVAVEATLLPSTQSGVIFDNVADKYWLTDLNFFADMTYTEQIQSINARNDLGLNWHMASGDEVRDLWLGNGYNFLDMFQGPGMYDGRIDSLTTWAFHGDWDYGSSVSGSYTNGVDPAHMVAVFGWTGDQLMDESGFNWYAYDDFSHHDLGAWVVADAPVPVPEPSTFLLLVLGIMFFMLSKKRPFTLFTGLTC